VLPRRHGEDSILKLLDLWHSHDTKLRSRDDSGAPFQEYPFLSSNVQDYLTILDDNFVHPALHFGAVEVFNTGYITIFVTNILRRFPSPPDAGCFKRRSVQGIARL
jgi:hypothetical protein